MNVDMSNPTDLGALVVTLAFMLGACWAAVKVGKFVLGVGDAAKASVESGVKTTRSMGSGNKLVVLGVIALILGPFVMDSDPGTGIAITLLGLVIVFVGGRTK